MRRRATGCSKVAGRAVALAGIAGFGLAFPAPALAHGISSRADLPIPDWLFAWGAAIVLIVSFVALAALWPTPKLENERWRPLPLRIGRVLASRPVEILCGAIGIGLLLLVLWSGFRGLQETPQNFAPTFIYVIFWVGLVPLSVVFGDVYRAFNPLRAAGRAIGWVASKAAGERLDPLLRYPQWLGRWPAVVGIFLFAWLELAASSRAVPYDVALATLVYMVITAVGMAMFGVEAWSDRGDAFSVYFNVFSRISPFERRGDEIGVRRPLSGLTHFDTAVAGTVPLLATMIGEVSFDGTQEGPVWATLGPDLTDVFQSLGLGRQAAVEVATTIGLIVAILVIYGLYRLGVAGARTVGGNLSSDRLAAAFVHSLVPIAVVYVGAHYFTFLVFQGQAMIPLASDPLGHGSNLFGTARDAINYTLIGAAAIWYVQVGLVLAGHVAALALAHDRALVLYDRPQLAVRSQYWMLAVMVGFTSLALWLLAQANI